MNRGSATLASDVSIRTISFNEAPIHESGKWRYSTMRLDCFISRFNEAPIHESGKSEATAMAAHRGVVRFNEAPIHESGKSCQRESTGALGIASMRPRFMNRGSGRRQDERMGRGSGFNEAPIHESGKW